jgi:hypothetical protein
MNHEVLGLMIPILVPLGLFALLFGLRYFHNKENLAMIEKGMNPRINMAQPRPYKNLKVGLLMLGAGIGLLLAYFITYAWFPHDENPAIYFGLIGIFGGIGLIVSYRIEKKEVLDKYEQQEAAERLEQQRIREMIRKEQEKG